MRTIELNTEDATRELAREYAAKVTGGEFFELNGNLGAGKTFFTRALCAELGIGRVTSPTFALVNEYEGNKRVIHFDFYRIESEQELLNTGYREYVNDTGAIMIVEWGDRFPEMLPPQRTRLHFSFVDENARVCTIEDLQ